MRLWIFHPLAFYPLAALLALLVIGISLQPQAWPREARPVQAQVEDGALVLRGDALGAPQADSKQHLVVTRDVLGHARTLRIAQIPNLAPLSAEDDGVTILLEPDQAALIAGKPTIVEVSYRPLPVNVASGLAVSLRGAGPATWVHQAAQPLPATLRFEVPAAADVTAIGLRATSPENDQAYGLEITHIRIEPQGS